jgi:transcriptional repressor NrdR
MKCPFCGHADTQVKDSRPSEDGMSIRRRRYCPECNSRFTTFERVQLRELTVLKKNGERRIFDRDKLARSIHIALRKRPVTQDQIEQLITRVTQKLESMGESEIPTALNCHGRDEEGRFSGLYSLCFRLPRFPRSEGF